MPHRLCPLSGKDTRVILAASVAEIKLVSSRAGICGADTLAETTKMPPQQTREVELLRRELIRIMSQLPDSAARLTFLETVLLTQLELDDGSELEEEQLRMIYEALLWERMEVTGAAAKFRQGGPAARAEEISRVRDETALHMSRHPRIEDVLAKPDPELRLRLLICKLRRLKYLQQYAMNEELQIGHEDRIRQYERLIEGVQIEIGEKRKERERKAEESLNRVLKPSIFELFICCPDPVERISLLRRRSEHVLQHIRDHGEAQLPQKLLEFYHSLTEKQEEAIRSMQKMGAGKRRGQRER